MEVPEWKDVEEKIREAETKMREAQSLLNMKISHVMKTKHYFPHEINSVKMRLICINGMLVKIRRKQKGE